MASYWGPQSSLNPCLKKSWGYLPKMLRTSVLIQNKIDWNFRLKICFPPILFVHFVTYRMQSCQFKQNNFLFIQIRMAGYNYKIYHLCRSFVCFSNWSQSGLDAILSQQLLDYRQHSSICTFVSISVWNKFELHNFFLVAF